MYAPAPPRQREARLAEIVRDFASEPAVVGIFLAGSLASGNADAHSDIDLRVVVESAALSRFCADRLSRPTRWTGFLFNEWSDDEACCVSHFEGFGKVDVFYLGASQLEPSPWLALPIIVLHDPTGIIGLARARSAIEHSPTDEHLINRAVGKAVACAVEVGRRVGRGELIYAQSLLDGLRQRLVDLEDLLENRRPGLNCSFKIEERVSAELLAALYAACPSAIPAELQRALAQLAGVCRALVWQLHERSKLVASPESFVCALDALAE
jgi:hypothetical protein